MPEKLVNNKNLKLYIFKPFILFDPKFKTNEIGEILLPDGHSFDRIVLDQHMRFLYLDS